MALVKWDPFKELENIHKRISKILEEPFFALRPKYDEESLMETKWTPAVDVYEDKDNIIINAEIPGVKKEDIKIELTGNQLTISGERKLEKEEKKKNYHRIERFYGNFMRTFTIPDTVQKDKISASYKDGILKVVLPKAEEAKPKEIKIEVK